MPRTSFLLVRGRVQIENNSDEPRREAVSGGSRAWKMDGYAAASTSSTICAAVLGIYLVVRVCLQKYDAADRGASVLAGDGHSTSPST